MLTTAGRVIFNAEIDRALREAVGELDGEYTTYHDFLNRTLSKKELGDFISTLVDEYGAHAVAVVLDTIKDLGFHYGTKAGVTISKNDVVIPPEKEKILAEYEERVAEGRAGVRARPHHRVRASRVDREHLDGGDRDGRRGDGRRT